MLVGRSAGSWTLGRYVGTAACGEKKKPNFALRLRFKQKDIKTCAQIVVAPPRLWAPTLS
jgi:hypothetical protein